MARANGANNKREKQLTLREERFVEAMADPRTKSNTQAAIQAGYAPKNARIIAAQNLTKLNIFDAIRHRKQRALEHAEVTGAEVLGSAVFQMRSSMADVLNDEGSFNIEKARETGAVDLLKKHKETIRELRDNKGQITETIKTVEVEMLTNQDARKEVANYIGLERFAPPPQSQVEHIVKITRQVATMNGETVEETLSVVMDLIEPEFVEDVKRILLGDGK